MVNCFYSLEDVKDIVNHFEYTGEDRDDLVVFEDEDTGVRVFLEFSDYYNNENDGDDVLKISFEMEDDEVVIDSDLVIPENCEQLYDKYMDAITHYSKCSY